MRPLKILTGSVGINTKTDAVRLTHSYDGNAVPAAALVNAEVRPGGRLARRMGFARTAAGDFERCFSYAGMCLLASRTAIYRLSDDLETASVVLTMDAGRRVAFCGAAGRVFWTNGLVSGMIVDGAYQPWEKGPDVGPQGHRSFTGPPPGRRLFHFNGRIFVQDANDGRVIWYSEPLDYGRFDLARNFVLFPEPVEMAVPVDDGIYVAAGDAVMFLGGADPSKGFDRRTVGRGPVIPGMEASGFGGLAGGVENRPAVAVGDGPRFALWATDRGVFYGGPGGSVVCLTRDYLQELPMATAGAGVVHGDVYMGVLRA